MRRGTTLLGATLGVLAATDVAAAHVRYVTEESGSPGAVLEFLVDVASNPVNLALLGGGALTTLLAMVGYLRLRPLAADIDALRDALEEYGPYLPWMLRLSIGLPLVGAGFAGYLFSPEVTVSARVLQVTLGFLLLFGLATRAAAVAGLLVYLGALAFDPQLLLAVEYVGGFVAIALLGSGRPSADHLLNRVADAPGTFYGRIDPVHHLAARFTDVVAPYRQFVPVAVRASLGVAFVYLGLWEKLAHPNRALAVVEKYDLTAVVPVDPGLWVAGAAFTEIAVGALLLLGLFTRAAAAVAFLTLTTTLFGLPDDPVLAHVTLFGLTSLLFVTGSGPLALDGRLRETAHVPSSIERGTSGDG